jgi:hypothetical protein
MRALLVLLLLPLAACATLGNPNVRTIGPEIFALQETMPKKAAEAKAMRISLIKEAKAFCAKRGQSVEISNEDVLDATSRVYQVTFQCPQGLPEDTGVGALTLPKPISVNPKPSAVPQPDADNLGF